jgi:protein ATS1
MSSMRGDDIDQTSAEIENIPVVYALGSNCSGQLGVGHTDDIDAPRRCIFRATTSTFTDVHTGPAKKMVAGGNHTLLLTTTGLLFATGRFNLNLGDGRKSSSVFEAITPLPGEFGTITDIAASWEASFIVFDRKVIVTWGNGLKGELGSGEDVTSTDGAVKVVLDVKVQSGDERIEILSISASISHVVALCTDGQIYAWGASRKGQLGDQFVAGKILWSPVRIDIDFTGQGSLHFAPTTAVLGRDYTVLCRAGQKPLLRGRIPGGNGGDQVFGRTMGEDCLLVSGWTTLCRLSHLSGHQQLASVGRSVVPSVLPPLRFLAAGSEHCVALTANDRILAWGWNEHGNCGRPVGEKVRGSTGVDRSCNEIVLPRDALDLVPSDVAAGCATTFVVCSMKEAS